MAVLYGNDAFSILVLSTKKRYSSFLKKVFVFQKIYFKVKVLKTFKIFTDCHKKHADLTEDYFWRYLVPFFRRTYALAVCFKMKSLKKSIFQFLDKNQPIFCRKAYWKEQPFIFTACLMNHTFQTSVFLFLDNRMY